MRPNTQQEIKPPQLLQATPRARRAQVRARLVTLLLVLCATVTAHSAGAPGKSPPSKLKVRETPWFKVPPLASLREIIVSPDCRHFAFPVMRRGRWSIFVDGEEKGLYRTVGSLLFSPNGERLAASVESEDGRVVVVDDKPGKAFDDFGLWGKVFSPDGKHLAYIARRGNTWRVVLDAKEGKAYDGIGKFSLVFSSDSQSLAYVAKRGNKYLTVQGDQEGPEYDGIGDQTLSFAPDGKSLRFVAKRGDKCMVVLDGKECAMFGGVGDVLFSADGRSLAYVAGSNGVKFVVFNGVAGKAYQGIRAKSLAMSADGKTLAYLARDRGFWHAVANGRESPGYSDLGKLALSPDGKRLAYAGAQNGNGFLVVDGGTPMPVEGFISESLSFSPDSAHWVCAAIRDGKSTFLVDGFAAGSFRPPAKGEDNTTLGTIAFTGPRSLRGFGSRLDSKFDLEVLQIEIEILDPR